MNEQDHREQQQALEALRARHPWPGRPPPSALCQLDVDPARRLVHSLLTGKERLILELGTVFGGSARDFAARCPASTVICLASWPATILELRPEQLGLSAGPDGLWQAFLAGCWRQRERLIPMRMQPEAGLRALRELGLRPDLIYVEAGRPAAAVCRELAQARSMFPEARVVGRSLVQGESLEGLQRFCRQHRELAIRAGAYWRIWPLERPQSAPLLLSVHVPKASGSSFGQVLQQAFPGALLRGRRPPVEVPPHIRAVHGHFALFGARPPHVVPLVWLRDPVRRVVSHYHFWRRRPDMTNGLCRQMVEQDLSLLEFAALPGMRNRQTSFVGGLPLEDYALVGLTEQFARGVELFARLFAPEVRLRPVHANRSPRRVAISARERRLLAELNTADLELYERAQARFAELCREHL